MGTVYLLKNQHNYYLDKSGEWVNGENSKSLFRTAHKDEAINQKVEFTVKNFELRIEVAEVEIATNGTLKIEVAPPMEEALNDDEQTLVGEVQEGEVLEGEMQEEQAHNSDELDSEAQTQTSENYPESSEETASEPKPTLASQSNAVSQCLN